MKKRGFKILAITIAVLLLLFTWFYLTVTVTEPKPTDLSAIQLQRETVAPDFYRIGNNWLKKSDSGLWEMYLEGPAFDRGVINGKLCKELAEKQEVAFVGQIQKIVPSRFYLFFLKLFIGWFNRNLDDNVPEEYRQEIFGVSRSASDDYDWIASKYQRILNYHAAHDIGHAMQDKNLVVGCTSFSTWGSQSTDSSLIVARNFDFYAGDAFAQDKIVFFVKPDSGYKFMSVAWGGMVGVVSGMNEAGLTVTINAGKSDIPSGASTPISILAREILQYASTIEEAWAIAKKRNTFVSESLMIGSWKDHETGIIEKSPTQMGRLKASGEKIICSNHFESETFKKDEINLKNIAESDSPYRYERVEELMNEAGTMDVEKAVSILRNRQGIKNADLGMGSQKAINQLNAHHAIVFKPGELKVWISTPPWQLGGFVCYDFATVFAEYPGLKQKMEITDSALYIQPDSFLFSTDYQLFLKYRQLKSEIKECMDAEKKCSTGEKLATAIVLSNPEYFFAHELAGDYWLMKGNKEKAAAEYSAALTKEIPSLEEKKRIEGKKKSIQSKSE